MPLRVLSYNIREGGQDRLGRIAEVIRGQRPDVIALIEATSLDNAARLASDLSLELAVGQANGRHHVCWLSQLPIVRAHNHRSPLLAKTLLEIEVAVDGEPVSLFATHLGSRHDVPKAITEIPVILDAMSRLGDRPHLLVGDLNALRPDDPVGEPPPGVTKRGEAIDGAPRPAIPLLLARGYLDGYRAMHPETPGYTYPADAPWLRLDYVFLSPPLAGRLAGCDVVAGPESALASDHLPIWAEIR